MQCVYKQVITYQHQGKPGLGDAYLFRSQNPVAHMNLGAMLHMQGKLDEAEKSYMKALELRPGDQLTKENLRKLRSLKAKRNTKVNIA